MTWLWGASFKFLAAPAWSSEPELLDGDAFTDDELAGNLADLRRINRLLGGVWLTRHGLERLTPDFAAGSHLTILDVATGGADIPQAMRRWALRRGFDAEIVASDLSPRILRSVDGAERAGLNFVVADARCLPLPDRSVDIVTTSLSLHHFQPPEAVDVLREMRRVARRGVVVNDLLRCWHGYAGARVMSRVVVRNSLTRVDAPRSVLRAHTRHEFVALMRAAGFERLAIDSLLGYRIAATGWCDS
jgi:ubiquinone/menaquinone biosynthesis C-methylase UbiE